MLVNIITTILLYTILIVLLHYSLKLILLKEQEYISSKDQPNNENNENNENTGPSLDINQLYQSETERGNTMSNSNENDWKTLEEPNMQKELEDMLASQNIYDSGPTEIKDENLVGLFNEQKVVKPEYFEDINENLNRVQENYSTIRNQLDDDNEQDGSVIPWTPDQIAGSNF
jgi:hypothetical protein